MKKLLVFILALAIATLTIQVSGYNFNIVADYQGLTYGLLFNALLFLIWSIVLQRKYNDRTKYKEFMEEQLTQCKADLVKEKKEHSETQSALHAEETLHAQTKQRLDIVLNQDKATIKLGDKVKNVKTNRTGIVCSIRLAHQDKDSNGRLIKSPQYRLSQQGKWFNQEEIRKVD